MPSQIIQPRLQRFPLVIDHTKFAETFEAEGALNSGEVKEKGAEGHPREPKRHLSVRKVRLSMSGRYPDPA